MFLRTILLSVLIIFKTTLSWSAPERLALLIGNQNYENGSLTNPVNDINIISKALKKK